MGNIPKVTPPSKVMVDLSQFMVSQDLSLEDVSDRGKEMAFPDSVFQYLRGDISVLPGGFPEPLQYKVMKYRNLDPVEGHYRDELGEYTFDKAAKELRSKYVLSTIYDKHVIFYWKDYKAIYVNVSHQLTTNIFLDSMEKGEEVELKVVPRKVSFIWLVATKSDLAREEGTRLVTYQNSALNKRGAGGGGSIEAEGEVQLPMPGVVTALKVEVGDETAGVEIVWKWGWSILRIDHWKRCMRFVKIQCSLTLGSATKY